MILEQVSPPDERLLDLNEVKQDLDIDSSAYDAKVLRMMIAAESYLDGRDGILGRCLRPQTWKLSVPTFSNCVELPLPPTRSVEMIQYYDDDEVLQTLATSQYTVIDGGYLGDKIVPADDVTYPNTYERPDAVQVTFVAGYEDNESPENEAIPESIRIAASMLCKLWYDEPGAPIPDVVDRLISPFRLTHIG